VGNYTTIVIDFETTGLSPGYGDRTIEVGAILISNRQIVDRFQSLMNPEMRVSGFIEEYSTGDAAAINRQPTVRLDMVESCVCFMAAALTSSTVGIFVD